MAKEKSQRHLGALFLLFALCLERGRTPYFELRLKLESCNVEDIRVPHRAQLAQSQDITQARNTHLLLEAIEILGSVCYTALSGECSLIHGASHYL